MPKVIDDIVKEKRMEWASGFFYNDDDEFSIQGINTDGVIYVAGRLSDGKIRGEEFWDFSNIALWWPSRLNALYPRFKYRGRKTIQQLRDEDVPWPVIEEIAWSAVNFKYVAKKDVA